MVGWCMACRGPSDVTISWPRRGTIAHYAACWDHVDVVVARARSDAGWAKPKAVPPRDGTIDVTASDVAGELTS